MRFLMLASLASCGHGSHTSAPIDAATMNRIAIQGECVFPLGPSGEFAFPDTAVGAQSYRHTSVVNEGPEVLTLDEIVWSFEGGDAADFAIAYGNGTELDSCFLRGLTFTPTIAFGQSCRLEVYFHPTTPGQKQTMLHVTYEYGSLLDQTFFLHGSAVVPPMAMPLGPTSGPEDSCGRHRTWTKLP